MKRKEELTNKIEVLENSLERVNEIEIIEKILNQISELRKELSDLELKEIREDYKVNTKKTNKKTNKKTTETIKKNQYKIIIYKTKYNNEIGFYRLQTYGQYKGEYILLINARDINFKELRNNKKWFKDLKHIKEEYIEEVKEYAKLKGYLFEIH